MYVNRYCTNCINKYILSHLFCCDTYEYNGILKLLLVSFLFCAILLVFSLKISSFCICYSLSSTISHSYILVSLNKKLENLILVPIFQILINLNCIK